MKYLIHAHKNRSWYVEGYLIPELKKQGIKPDVYTDNGAEGNLYATMNTFHFCGDAWHLQDDVVICHDFKDRTAQPDTIACGFCRLQDSIPDKSGRVKAKDMWFSFPCIYIPGEIAKECAEWFFTTEPQDENLKRLKALKKGDDSFFKAFIDERYPDIEVINMNPNLVDHVDYLIGGSIANKGWTNNMNLGSMAAYYEDSKEGLKRWLEQADQKQNLT